MTNETAVDLKPHAFTPSAGHAAGPDGRGWNRLSVNAHMFHPQERCMIRPTTVVAARTLHRVGESAMRRSAMSSFEPCSGEACSDCKYGQQNDHAVELTSPSYLVTTPAGMSVVEGATATMAEGWLGTYGVESIADMSTRFIITKSTKIGGGLINTPSRVGDIVQIA